MKTVHSICVAALAGTLAFAGSVAGQLLPGGKAEKMFDPAALKAAQGKATGPDDLRVHEFGHYIGGIDRAWGLVLTPAPDRRFDYFFEEFGTTRVTGTYEVQGSLVVFTGKATGLKDAFKPAQGKKEEKAIRFGLNFAVIDGKVHFNLLVPAGDGSYRYQRQWSEEAEGRWQIREERRLTFTPGQAQGDQIPFAVKGEVVRRGKDGKEVREPVDLQVTYKREGKTTLRLVGKAPAAVPAYLLEGVVGPQNQPFYHLQPERGWGNLRGFTVALPTGE